MHILWLDPFFPFSTLSFKQAFHIFSVSFSPESFSLSLSPSSFSTYTRTCPIFYQTICVCVCVCKCTCLNHFELHFYATWAFQALLLPILVLHFSCKTKFNEFNFVLPVEFYLQMTNWARNEILPTTTTSCSSSTRAYHLLSYSILLLSCVCVCVQL